jgi:hypothetical protein
VCAAHFLLELLPAIHQIGQQQSRRQDMHAAFHSPKPRASTAPRELQTRYAARVRQPLTALPLTKGGRSRAGFRHLAAQNFLQIPGGRIA